MPSVSDFLMDVELSCGSSGSEYQSNFNLGLNDSWSAAFVSYYVKKFNATDILPVSSRCSDFINKSMSDTVNCTWSSNGKGRTYIPVKGDVVAISWSHSDQKVVEKLGVVLRTNSDSGSIDVVIGDYGSTGPRNSTVRLVSFNTSSPCLLGYVHPKWE